MNIVMNNINVYLDVQIGHYRNTTVSLEIRDTSCTCNAVDACSS